MRDLLRRIWRYLNYAPNTHGKVEEIRQHLHGYLDDFPRRRDSFWKTVTAVEQVRTKVATIESDLHYLKSMMAALQSQLNSLQDHVRSSQPWLPSSEGSAQTPEGWLLLSLMSFFLNPVVVNICGNDDELFELLLEAGFEVYILAPDASSGEKPWARFSGRPGLHIVERSGHSLSWLTENKEIPTDFPVLRITTKELESWAFPAIGRLSPQIIDAAFSRLDASVAAELASGKQLIREMRSRGYRWNLLIFRIYGAPAFRFAPNLAAIPDTSSGNLLFFNDYQLFEETYRWAQLVLPRFQYRNG
jgi:hypothetical protein